MQIKRIEADHWFQTQEGIGKCLVVAANRAKFDVINGQVKWLTAKEVQYELPKDEADKYERGERPAVETSTDEPPPCQATVIAETLALPPRLMGEPEEDIAPSILVVLHVLKRHIDDLADAWRRGAIRETDGQGSTRSNRNRDVQHLLEKIIAKEKGTSS